ncbi:CTP synthetase [Marivivens donghaensis]|uniref:CTP synthetase n=1 Tax=Marivivens donghaensis TaxID=1699413 RepID=A0ABX0VWH2_9RHOB|nr:CTP synthetase [Marivivens donghaensis]NIY72311.1 CTP synthetase [Marivivens donghaensis]
MLRLASVLYSLISTTLAGTFVVAALVMGQDALQPIVIAAALGFVAALPVTWLVAKAMYAR